MSTSAIWFIVLMVLPGYSSLNGKINSYEMFPTEAACLAAVDRPTMLPDLLAYLLAEYRIVLTDEAVAGVRLECRQRPPTPAAYHAQQRSQEQAI